MRSNLRMIMNILKYYETHLERQLVLIFSDAEKAFDNVSWEFILEMLRSLQVGETFKKMINAIYMQETAKIRINGEMTEEIQICKGIRQGCPLSPLLFIWSLVFLNIAIRENPDIRGTRISGEEYKI